MRELLPRDCDFQCIGGGGLGWAQQIISVGDETQHGSLLVERALGMTE